MPDFGDLYALVGFVGTVAFAAGTVLFAIYKAARWLLERFTELFDRHQETLEKKVDDLAEKQDAYQQENVGRFEDQGKKLDELTVGVKSVEAVQNQHAERIAWLEGQSGQPLGSVVRER